MKLGIFLLLLCPHPGWANTSYAENISFNMDYSNVELEVVFESIRAQSEFELFYNNDQVDTSVKVSVKARDADIKTVLEQVLPAIYEYKINDRYILINKRKGTKSEIAPVPEQTKKRITGVITNEEGESIIGANIVESGTTNGTITDLNGYFTLEVEENAAIHVSYIGYLDHDINTIDQNHFEIILFEDTKMLDELVVVGYGAVRKKDLSGAVGTIKGDDLALRRTTHLSSALQGAVSGVMVTRNNNAPGAAAQSIHVRGITTIGNSDPLVIVDGVPGDINLVNPNDVESISVLKDAASASIYGARAAAGVVLVTTKRAKNTDFNLTYTMEFGRETPTQQPEYVGIQRFLEMNNELRYNDNPSGGMFQAYSQEQVENWIDYNKTDPNTYPITDWTDLILKKYAPRQTHTLGISGGSKITATKASFTYDKVDGLYADRDYQRYMLRVNNDFKINKYLGATLDLNWRRSLTHQPTYNPISGMRITPAVYAALWDDGRIAEGKSGANPYGQMLKGGDQDASYNQIGGKAAINLTPIKGLTISGVVAPIYNFNKIKNFKLAIPFTLADDPNIFGGYLGSYTSTDLTERRTDNYNITSQIIATYIKSTKQHNFNLMAGYENYYSFNESLMASRDQYELTSFPYLDIGPETYRDNSGNAHEIAYRSFFGRLMYSYMDRYLLQANVRNDGSSRFSKDYRWGVFPSFSAGWVLSEESFINELGKDWLSFLKLRASWGTLGNERIGNYPYQATIEFANVLFYQNNQAVSELSAAQRQYAIENISWETTESFNVGLDFSFLNNRLRCTTDYYYKTTKDMLLALEIPDYVGYNNPDKNTGKMNTRGYDLEASWMDRIGDWSYSISFNFSDFISKMGDLGGTQFLGDQVKMEGSEFNEWYGYLTDGLFYSQEELNNAAKIDNNVKVGDIKYIDISGPDGVPDGKISPEYDRVLLGGSLPRYMFGGNLNVGYKGIDMSLTFQGVGKQNVRMNTTMIQPLRQNYGNIPEILDGNYWSSLQSEIINKSVKYPRLTFVNASSNYAMSDFWMFNGRYIRIKNITLGYTIPRAFTQKINMSNVRFYVSANDLLSISKFPKGWDPEMGASAYPITTSVLFGLSMKF